jgi:hypothetical protein
MPDNVRQVKITIDETEINVLQVSVFDFDDRTDTKSQWILSVIRWIF